MLQPWPETEDPLAGDSRPRIMLAAGRPPMTRVAGAVADGVLTMPLCSPAFAEAVIRPMLAEGAAQAGREQPVPLTGLTICTVGENSAQARALAAMQVAVFADRASAGPLMAFHGFEAEVAEIREAFRRHDIPGVADAVSDRMLDQLAVYGTPEEARERFTATFDGVYDEALLFTAGKGMPEGGFQESVLGACEAFEA